MASHYNEKLKTDGNGEGGWGQLINFSVFDSRQTAKNIVGTQ